jgi:hypothetical protein
MPEVSIIASETRIIVRTRPWFPPDPADSLDSNLHSPERRLIELRMEHADLDALIDRAGQESPVDELMMRRLKKRRLALRDQIARLELALDPKEPA